MALYHESEDFKHFTQNAGVGMREVRLFNEGLLAAAHFEP